MLNFEVTRRRFLQGTTAAIAASPLVSRAAGASPDDLNGRIYKTLKIGMVNVPGSLVDRFKAVKAAGFDGIELNSPGNNVDEVRKAIAESGLPVDGSVCASHWQVRHTDPDAGVRAKALRDLRDALRETHAVGGHTVLLVGNHWKYGNAGNWIRALGRRVIKLDAKGFSRAKNAFTDIGEGDIDWADVRKALLEINFHGWAAAEVGGGDAGRLRKIASQMEQVFALKPTT
jgi:sugar phosphate isomerase/epimerase